MKVFRYLVLILTTMLAAGGVRAQHPIHPAVRWAKMGAGFTSHISFSPDGNIVGNSIAGGYMFTETATGAIRAILPGVHGAAFSPDGKLVACAAGKVGALLLDGDTFQPVDTLVFIPHPLMRLEITFVMFSLDGTRLLTNGPDFLGLWDMQTRTLIRPGLKRIAETLKETDVSPDGRTIAIHQATGIALYSAEDGAELDILYSDHLDSTANILNMRFSPDDSTLLVAMIQREGWYLVVWNYRERRVVRKLLLPIQEPARHAGRPADITVTADGRYVAVSNGRASSLQFIDVETGAPGKALYFKRPVYTGLSSPDGRYLAVGGYSLHMHLLDAATWNYVRDIPLGQEREGQSLAISLDGRLVATSSARIVLDDGRPIRVWDVATGTLKQMVMDPKAHALPLSFTPDGTGVMVPMRCGPSSAEIYSVESGEFVREFPCDPENGPRKLIAPHPDGRHMLVVTWDSWKLVDAETYQVAPGGSHRGLRVITMSSDGRRLATWGLDTLIRIWNVESRTEIDSIPALLLASDTTSLLALSSDGSHLLATIDHRIHLYNIATGQERILTGNQGTTEAIALSPDGEWGLATGSQGAIYVWRVSTGELVYTYSPAEQGIDYDWTQLVIAPDFTSFTTLSSQGSVVNWSTDPVRSLSVPGERRAMPETVPASMNLSAYPNPASAGAEIRFNPAGAFTGALRVYDASGRSIATLAEGTFEPGEQSYRWDDRVAPGLYIIGIQREGEIVARTFLCVE